MSRRNQIYTSLFSLRQFVLALLIVLAGCEVHETTMPTASDSSPRLSAASFPSSKTETVSASSNEAEPAPRIEVTSTSHDFGEMNPHQFGEHEFVVRNVGDAPLELRAERSTCKCTVVELSDEPIEPGGEAQVVLRWQTAKNNRRFSESATLATNDPDQEALTFKVSGDVLVHVGANPPELVLPGVHPGKGASVTTIVTSQVWNQFDIEGLDCSLKGYQATLAPATAEQLKKLKAKSGQQVTIHVPGSLPQGDFHHWVRFHIVPPDGDAEPKMYELPLKGRVLRRLAVYGQGIDHTGKVSLGVINSHQGHKHRLVMKVRDPDPVLRVDRISCNPSYLQIGVTSLTTKTNTKGLYYLDIEIPKSSPVGRFQASEAGAINIHFDHPRIANLELKVDFAVSGHRRSPSNQQTTNQPKNGVLARRTNR